VDRASELEGHDRQDRHYQTQHHEVWDGGGLAETIGPLSLAGYGRNDYHVALGHAVFYEEILVKLPAYLLISTRGLRSKCWISYLVYGCPNSGFSSGEFNAMMMQLVLAVRGAVADEHLLHGAHDESNQI
jgi:hypothetical protein